MKLYKKITLGLAACMALTSCNDWLDINSNPNSPSDASASYYQNLSHCQFYTNSAYMFAAFRTGMAMGDYTMNSTTSTYGGASCWTPAIGWVTTPYQWFFVGAGSNLQGMYEKAMAAGAYHYAGAAQFLKAYGFMLMTDLYGEMPFTEALGENALPAYDTGKTIYLGCFDLIDEAIDLFQRQQADGAQPLVAGDSWNQGDAGKWLKMCYLMKARWINKLTKKGTGSYKDGKYDAATILDCLSKALQSNADNTIINHLDGNSSSHDVLGWDEPVDYAPLYSVWGMNSNYYPTKMLVDNLTNFDGKGIEDPRADHMIPWAYFAGGTPSIPDYVAGQPIKITGKWRRSAGVDMHTLIRTNGAPYSTSYSVSKGGWYCDNDKRKGDTIFVQTTSSSKGYAANVDLLYRRLKGDDRSKQSGIFINRVSAPGYVAIYPEACFIKAEVLFRQGNKAEAYAAYKEGTKASIELMNDKLKAWVAEDAGLNDCPSFTPMQQADIDNYLNGALGTANDLTLAKIMTQKRLALQCSVEIFNDMRRLDYETGCVLNWEVPAEYTANTNLQQDYIPLGKGLRRWRQCSHEFNYNVKNLQAIGSQVPGAESLMDYVEAGTSSPCWNRHKLTWSIPVWWDSTQE